MTMYLVRSGRVIHECILGEVRWACMNTYWVRSGRVMHEHVLGDVR